MNRLQALGWARRMLRVLMLAFALVGAWVQPAAAGAILYATGTRVGPGTGPGALYQIDPASGAATRLFELSGFVHGGGLVYDPTTDLLYATGYDDLSLSSLWSINRYTGAQTFVGHTGAAVDQWGLAIDPLSGTLFATGDNQRQNSGFFTLDKATGAASYLGQATGTFTRLYGLGFGDDGLLYANGFDDPFTHEASLFTVNTATGATALVGRTGVTAGRRTSYSGVVAGPGGLLLSLGSIDASATGGLYAINPLTGDASLIGSTLLPLGVDGGLAMAPDQAPRTVPEPAPGWLLGVGAVMLVWFLRRQPAAAGLPPPARAA